MKLSFLSIKNIIFLSSILVNTIVYSQSQLLNDNFEGNSTITKWIGDDCLIDTSFNNPHSIGLNTSSKVLRYADVGGQFANVRFDTKFSFNLTTSSVFSFKIYVPSSGLTGNQVNQVSLKLQNSSLPAPWQTQCEITKPLLLNQWQTITFNFASDAYINTNATSGNPINRWDFSRVLLQINGENNNANVLAYIDDFLYSGSYSTFNNLTWNDEFDGNGNVNNIKWFHQTQIPNGISWYNNEQQHYTNNLTNSFLSNGILNIVAKKETYTSQLQTKQYTSARLNSKFAFKYGRVEVRAKLPIGSGTWPAIWMLGKNINEPGAFWFPTHATTNWPACGEIDIMEHWGANQNVISSAVHFPVNGNLNAGQYVTSSQVKSTVSSEFHVYAVDWNAQRITFSVDGINYFSYNPATKNQYTWPFDAEQYILLNVAIEPRVLSNFVQSAMEIDYLRVFQENVPLPLKFTGFIINKINDKVVENKWTTNNEINVSYFNIERSINGKDFLEVAKIDAKNGVSNSYNYKDELAFSDINSTYFYRIKSVDKDGSISFSEVKQITFENSNSSIKIYPTPTKSVITIKGLTLGEAYTITDIKGKVLKQGRVTQLNFSLNIADFAKGIYVIKSTSGLVQKVIKE